MGPQFLWLSALAHLGRLWLAGLVLRAGLSGMMSVNGLGKVLYQPFSPPTSLAQDAMLLAVMLVNIVVVDFTHGSGVRVSLSLYLLEALL